MTSTTMGTSDRVLTPVTGPDAGGTYERSALAEKVDRVTDRAEGLYQRTKKRAIELEGKFEDSVKESPIKSLLVAAGVGAAVGVALGVLLGRRR